jgi:hypothetical protein
MQNHNLLIVVDFTDKLVTKRISHCEKGGVVK